jgi:hypothetical protein
MSKEVQLLYTYVMMICLELLDIYFNSIIWAAALSCLSFNSIEISFGFLNAGFVDESDVVLELQPPLIGPNFICHKLRAKRK